MKKKYISFNKSKFTELVEKIKLQIHTYDKNSYDCLTVRYLWQNKYYDLWNQVRGY